jgi:hypothetical protein
MPGLPSDSLRECLGLVQETALQLYWHIQGVEQNIPNGIPGFPGTKEVVKVFVKIALAQ